MPEQKDLKRLVRARMQKTGESYTAARSQLLAKRSPAPQPARPAAASPKTPPRDLAAIAGMSDEAVRAKTGKTWQEWVRTLDAEHAASLTHRDIATKLATEHGVPSWWSQMVTVGYERIRGLREKGQGRDGGYEVSKSKTVGVPIGVLYRAFAEHDRWLAGIRPTIRRARDRKDMRLTWPDGTHVDVVFLEKGPSKSQVAIQHGRIATREAADQLRSFWTARLAALAELLSAGR